MTMKIGDYVLWSGAQHHTAELVRVIGLPSSMSGIACARILRDDGEKMTVPIAKLHPAEPAPSAEEWGVHVAPGIIKQFKPSRS